MNDQKKADAITLATLWLVWGYFAYNAPGPAFYRVAVWFALGYLAEIKMKLGR